MNVIKRTAAMAIAAGWTRKRSTEAMPVGTKIVVTVAPSRAGGEAVLVPAP